MKTFSMRYFLRKAKGQQTDAKLFMRINVRGKITDFSLNRKIRESDWDQDAGKPKGRSGTARELERFMATVEEKLYAVERALIEKNIPVTSQNLVRHFTQAITGNVIDNRKTVRMIFDEHNKQVLELWQTGQVVRPTYSRYVNTQRYFSEFLSYTYNKTDIPLAELQPGDVVKFEHWLKTKKDCEHNTALKYIKNLKKVVKMAVTYGWMDKDPFGAFRAKLKHVNREFLTADELQKIESLKIDIDRLRNVRNWFLFSCYTGLAYVDLFSLRPSDIVADNEGDHWILKERQKTRIISRIPLLDRAATIVSEYKNHPFSNKKGTIFPVFSNQRMNAYLKEIADLAGIKKRLTFHIARHTFATTVTLANGVSLEAVSAQLGHTNTRMTQHYAKMVDSRIKREMNLVKQAFQEK